MQLRFLLHVTGVQTEFLGLDELGKMYWITLEGTWPSAIRVAACYEIDTEALDNPQRITPDG